MSTGAIRAIRLGVVVVALGGLCSCAPASSSPLSFAGAPSTAWSAPAENPEATERENKREAEEAGAVACAPAASDAQCAQALTGFLHTHRLPLVGAQVVKDKRDKRRQVVLYGFTGTLQGKSNAEDHARDFLNDPNAVVVSRIKVAPELAKSSEASEPAQAPPPVQTNESPDIQAYQQQEIRRYQEQQMLNPWGGPTFGFGSGFGGGWGGGFGMGFGPSPLYPSPSPFFWP